MLNWLQGINSTQQYKGSDLREDSIRVYKLLLLIYYFIHCHEMTVDKILQHLTGLPIRKSQIELLVNKNVQNFNQALH
jgi:hypothetical protein